MSLIRLRNVCLSYGGPLLLDHIQLGIDKRERVCLLGRNGQGKSSLLKVIAGEIKPDSGEVEYQEGLKIAVLPQAVPENDKQSVFAVVIDGLGEKGELILAYHELLNLAQQAPDDSLINERLYRVQDALNHENAWGLENQVEKVISQMNLNGDDRFGDLSGGFKRRVLLAQALVSEPDVLLLDEPTNHLDIDSIHWIENFLLQFNGTLVFVTHDRRFLQRLATRIIELDLGQLTSWPGDYQTYLTKRAELASADAKHQSEFDKKLAKEEVWVRQGIKARRTRNEGRVRKLEAMRQERSQRRSAIGNANLKTQGTQASGRKVVETKHVSFLYQDEAIIKDFSTTVMRGDKIGIIGPNGCGKTTLLNMLLGKLKPTEGSVTEGTQLQVAYFDQLREQLDDEKTVLDNFAEGQSHIDINGSSVHVLGYLSQFLFSPAQSRSPVKALSGGEKNRLLLAKLLSKPSNVLVLDEPTNDLDLETLELLESMLVDYTGTILLVSHDRDFLNNVIMSSMVFEGEAKVTEYVGGYDDWIRQRPVPKKAKAEIKKEKPQKKEPQKKMSFDEKKELKSLPKKIERLEAKVAELQKQMATPEFYQQSQEQIQKVTIELEGIESELEKAYERWSYLDELTPN
jgi:ABC transport system ATP-binding/permease protein